MNTNDTASDGKFMTAQYNVFDIAIPYMKLILPIISIIFTYLKRKWTTRTTIINMSASPITFRYIQLRFKNFKKHTMSSEEETLLPQIFSSGSQVLWLWDYFICGTRFYIKIDRHADNDEDNRTSIISAVYENELPAHRILHVRNDGLYIDNILCAVWARVEARPAPFVIES